MLELDDESKIIKKLLVIKVIHFWLPPGLDGRNGCHAVNTMLAMYMLSSCVYPSQVRVTSRSSSKMAKIRIMQTIPHDSRGTLVFWCKRSRQNSNVITTNGGGLTTGGVG